MTQSNEGGPNQKERASKKLEEWLAMPQDPLWYAGVACALVAAAGLLLPWLWLDDYPAAFGLANLIMFYPSHDDEIYIISTTPLGTLTMLVAPIFIVIFGLGNAAKAILNVPSIGIGCITLIFVAALCGLTGEITDPDRGRIGAWAIPQAGMAMTIVGTLGAMAIGGWQMWRGGAAREGESPSRKFEW